MEVDVLVCGGGPAGLSAALILGRCHRRALVCDGGKPRNRFSHAIHGLLGQEGKAPSVFLKEARRDLEPYKTISVKETRVVDIKSLEDRFAFGCEDGTAGLASKILLTTGIADDLPSVVGIESFYGVTVHHCLYCDGFEYKGKLVAAYGRGDKGADLALMMKHWVTDVVACSDGTEVSGEMRHKLKEHSIPCRTEPIISLEGSRGILSNVKFAVGPDLNCAGLFFSTGCHQGSNLAERLGCQRDEKGGVITNATTEETSVPGVYVAGDVSRDVLLVAAAIAEGAKAAVAINKAFLRRDGLLQP